MADKCNNAVEVSGVCNGQFVNQTDSNELLKAKHKMRNINVPSKLRGCAAAQ